MYVKDLPILNDNDKIQMKRLIRQLQQRARTVELKKRKEQHYQNKRKEFCDFIDSLINEKGFILVNGSQIYKYYYDKW